MKIWILDTEEDIHDLIPASGESDFIVYINYLKVIFKKYAVKL